jgi:hypothetical protein
MRTILGMLMEVLFPHKLGTAGFFLILFSLLIPVFVLLHIVEASFSILFLAFAAAIAGTLICLIGCTCYVHNNRA